MGFLKTNPTREEQLSMEYIHKDHGDDVRSVINIKLCVLETWPCLLYLVGLIRAWSVTLIILRIGRQLGLSGAAPIFNTWLECSY